MTRSEWYQKVCEAWDGDLCSRCGKPAHAFHVDGEGMVWSYCSNCDRDFWTAHERIPTSFDPEPVGPEDLPF
jgi:hypothetical protein